MITWTFLILTFTSVFRCVQMANLTDMNIINSPNANRSRVLRIHDFFADLSNTSIIQQVNMTIIGAKNDKTPFQSMTASIFNRESGGHVSRKNGTQGILKQEMTTESSSDFFSDGTGNDMLEKIDSSVEGINLTSVTGGIIIISNSDAKFGKTEEDESGSLNKLSSSSVPEFDMRNTTNELYDEKEDDDTDEGIDDENMSLASTTGVYSSTNRPELALLIVNGVLSSKNILLSSASTSITMTNITQGTSDTTTSEDLSTSTSIEISTTSTTNRMESQSAFPGIILAAGAAGGAGLFAFGIPEGANYSSPANYLENYFPPAVNITSDHMPIQGLVNYTVIKLTNHSVTLIHKENVSFALASFPLPEISILDRDIISNISYSLGITDDSYHVITNINNNMEDIKTELGNLDISGEGTQSSTLPTVNFSFASAIRETDINEKKDKKDDKKITPKTVIEIREDYKKNLAESNTSTMIVMTSSLPFSSLHPTDVARRAYDNVNKSESTNVINKLIILGAGLIGGEGVRKIDFWNRTKFENESHTVTAVNDNLTITTTDSITNDNNKDNVSPYSVMRLETNDPEFNIMQSILTNQMSGFLNNSTPTSVTGETYGKIKPDDALLVSTIKDSLELDNAQEDTVDYKTEPKINGDETQHPAEINVPVKSTTPVLRSSSIESNFNLSFTNNQSKNMDTIFNNDEINNKEIIDNDNNRNINDQKINDNNNVNIYTIFNNDKLNKKMNYNENMSAIFNNEGINNKTVHFNLKDLMDDYINESTATISSYENSFFDSSNILDFLKVTSKEIDYTSLTTLTNKWLQKKSGNVIYTHNYEHDHFDSTNDNDNKIKRENIQLKSLTKHMTKWLQSNALTTLSSAQSQAGIDFELSTIMDLLKRASSESENSTNLMNEWLQNNASRNLSSAQSHSEAYFDLSTLKDFLKVTSNENEIKKKGLTNFMNEWLESNTFKNLPSIQNLGESQFNISAILDLLKVNASDADIENNKTKNNLISLIALMSEWLQRNITPSEVTSLLSVPSYGSGIFNMLNSLKINDSMTEMNRFQDNDNNEILTSITNKWLEKSYPSTTMLSTETYGAGNEYSTTIEAMAQMGIADNNIRDDEIGHNFQETGKILSSNIPIYTTNLDISVSPAPISSVSILGTVYRLRDNNNYAGFTENLKENNQIYYKPFTESSFKFGDMEGADDNSTKVSPTYNFFKSTTYESIYNDTVAEESQLLTTFASFINHEVSTGSNFYEREITTMNQTYGYKLAQNVSYGNKITVEDQDYSSKPEVKIAHHHSIADVNFNKTSSLESRLDYDTKQTSYNADHNIYITSVKIKEDDDRREMNYKVDDAISIISGEIKEGIWRTNITNEMKWPTEKSDNIDTAINPITISNFGYVNKRTINPFPLGIYQFHQNPHKETVDNSSMNSQNHSMHGVPNLNYIITEMTEDSMRGNSKEDIDNNISAYYTTVMTFKAYDTTVASFKAEEKLAKTNSISGSSIKISDNTRLLHNKIITEAEVKNYPLSNTKIPKDAKRVLTSSVADESSKNPDSRHATTVVIISVIIVSFGAAILLAVILYVVVNRKRKCKTYENRDLEFSIGGKNNGSKTINSHGDTMETGSYYYYYPYVTSGQTTMGTGSAKSFSSHDIDLSIITQDGHTQENLDDLGNNNYAYLNQNNNNNNLPNSGRSSRMLHKGALSPGYIKKSFINDKLLTTNDDSNENKIKIPVLISKAKDSNPLPAGNSDNMNVQEFCKIINSSPSASDNTTFPVVITIVTDTIRPLEQKTDPLNNVLMARMDDKNKLLVREEDPSNKNISMEIIDNIKNVSETNNNDKDVKINIEQSKQRCRLP
ncbi:unnamed protein product [Gordionus sp. m RMFG-2023]